MYPTVYGASGWRVEPAPRVTPWVIILACAVLFVVAATLLWPSEPKAAGATQRPALNIEVVRPSRANWPVLVEAAGAVAAWEEASVGTQIGSYQLVDVRVNVGDQVRRGQVLARLNPALLRAEEAQLLARDAQARANDARAKGLSAVGGISDQEALQFATEASTARALLRAKQLEIAYTAITAPDDGVISARPATVGAVVPVGQELFRLIRRNRLEWRGEVTAAQLSDVAKGQTIALTLPDGSGARAVIRETAPTLDPQSRVAIVYADIAPGNRARAGMFVSGRIDIGDRPGLIVPAGCVVVRDGRSYVLVVTGDAPITTVALRRIEPGRRVGDAVEILRGLAGSERLVQRGGAFLNDGDVVRVVPARGGRR